MALLLATSHGTTDTRRRISLQNDLTGRSYARVNESVGASLATAYPLVLLDYKT